MSAIAKAIGCSSRSETPSVVEQRLDQVGDRGLADGTEAAASRW